jgi:hypothetical protein
MLISFFFPMSRPKAQAGQAAGKASGSGGVAKVPALGQDRTLSRLARRGLHTPVQYMHRALRFGEAETLRQPDAPLIELHDDTLRQDRLISLLQFAFVQQTPLISPASDSQPLIPNLPWWAKNPLRAAAPPPER